MTATARGSGPGGASGPAGREAGKPVAMATDAQGLASGDVAIELATRGDSRMRRLAWASAPVLTFVALIILWGVLVSVFRVPDYLVPAPQAVIPKLYQARQALWQNTVITLREIIIGFAITVVLSIPLGLVIAVSLVARRIAYPLLVFIQLVPKIAVAPLFLVWFGFGIQSKVLLTVLLSFFPLLLASIAGFQALDTRLLYLTRSMGASIWQTFWYVRFPSALHVIFAGLKTTATIAATAAIVAEFVGSNAGLGYQLLVATGVLDTPLIFAILLILTVIGIGLNYFIEAVAYFAMPWQRTRE
jgi:NitT/TauT family transport system permease protein